jgi:urease accessory protein
MRRALSIVKAAAGPFLDVVALDYEDRHRRRIVLTGEGGHEFLLDLGEVPDLRDGDGIVLAEGGVVLVKAALEPLMEIHAHDATHLTRIAWHIGNRHLAAEISGHSLRIRADHVIAAMVEGLGGHVHVLNASFNPEGGAYGGGKVMGHGHGHDHGHSQSHG